VIIPIQKRIVIYSNADFSEIFAFTNPDGSPTDLTGCRVVAQIRKNQVVNGSLLATMDSDLDDGSATLNTSDGISTIYIPASKTITLNWSNPAYWDALIVWSDGTIDRFAEGQAYVYPGCTTP
jgi:hypothetical protein